MAEVRVLVPLGELDLEDALAEALDAEGPEEEGSAEVYFVPERPVDEVTQIVQKLVGEEYKVFAGNRTVVVQPVAGVQWFKYPIPASDAYERELKKQVKLISEDPDWAAWWAEVPYSTLFFHVSSEEFPWAWLPHEGDLLVEARFPTDKVSDVPAHLDAILQRTADWLKRPSPKSPKSPKS